MGSCRVRSMTSDKSRWAELRAEGRWLELWADMRSTGTVQDMLELRRSMTPEECSADHAAREEMADTPEFRAASDTIAERPLTRILDRIEAIEGNEQRELAEAGRKLALAGRRAKRLQPA